MVLWIAHKIAAKVFFLPPHIKQEMEHEARFSLIKTLNNYNKKFKNHPTVSLRTEICWRCYDDIGDWLAKHTGCKTFETSKKYSLLSNFAEDHKVKEPENYPSPIQDIEDRENVIESKSIIVLIKRGLKLTQCDIDNILMTWERFNEVYKNIYSRRQFDNRRTKIRQIIREYIIQKESR